MHGYARTSTADQVAGLATQVEALENAGARKIYKEHSSAARHREQLDRLMERLEDGDTLIVTRMGRLARNVRQLLTLIDGNSDTSPYASSTSTATLSTPRHLPASSCSMFGAFAEFERSIMLERQRVGIEAAKADGKYKGRKPTAMSQRERIKALDAEGTTRTAIAAKLGISERSVYRVLAD